MPAQRYFAVLIVAGDQSTRARTLRAVVKALLRRFGVRVIRLEPAEACE